MDSAVPPVLHHKDDMVLQNHICLHCICIQTLPKLHGEHIPNVPLQPFLNLFPLLGVCQSRRLIRSSRPIEIFQPPQQGFLSVHARLQLLGKIVQLLGFYIINMIR